MKSALSNPSLWGLSVDIPSDLSRFQYAYLVFDGTGRVWVEPGPSRVIDFATLSGDINQEDTFEHGIQVVRDTLFADA
jgi:hypothetical protein